MNNLSIINISKIMVVGLLAVSVLFSCEEDEPEVQNAIATFSGSNAKIVENDDAGVTVTVTLDHAIEGSGSVTVNLSDQLIYGTDYVVDPDASAGSLVLSFADGESSKSFTVTPIDNNIKNTSKLLSLTLSGVEGAIVLGAQKTFEISILNEDEVMDVVLKAEKSSVSEITDTVTISLKAAAALTTPGKVVLDLNTTDAVYGEDYFTEPAAENGMVSIAFAVGDTLQVFKLITIDNEDIEENKSLTISVNSYEGGVQAADQSLEFEILNDDALADPTLTPDVSDLSFGEIIIGEGDSVKSYEISVTDLVGDVEITSDNKRILLSETEEGTFEQSLTMSAGDFSGGNATVYVKYVVDSVSEVSATITHNTTNLPSEVVIDVEAATIYKPGILESFEYGASSGNFVDLHVGSDWVKVAGNTVSYTSTSLSMTDYPGSGDGGAIAVNQANGWANFSLPVDSLFGAGTYYVSAMIQVNQLNGADKFGFIIGKFKPDGKTDFGPQLYTTNDGAGKVKIGINKKGTSPISYLPGSYELNQTYTVVIRIQRVDNDETTDNDIVSLAVFDSALPSQEPSSYDAVATTGGDRHIAAVILKQTGNDNDFTIDGIQTSRDWQGLLE